MFEQRAYHWAIALLVIVLSLPCRLSSQSDVCAQGAACSCTVDANSHRITAMCQVESLRNLTTSIKKPEQVHKLVITGLHSPSVSDNAFINFSNLVILSLRGNQIRRISDRSLDGLRRLSQLDLAQNQLEEWDGDINQQLPSLTSLNVSGNINWTITENFLNHKSLKIITGVYIGTNCTACTLVRNYDMKVVSGEKDSGVIIRENCLQYKYVFNKNYQAITRHHFFPQCFLNKARCLEAVGRVKTNNICLEAGRDILIVAFPIGIVSFLLNLIVLAVIVTSNNLRSNSSLLLVCSMCASGVLSSIYSVAVAAVYQIVPIDAIEGRRISICPYLGFVISVSICSMVIISLVVTIERYLAVVYCMKPHIRLRVKHVYYCLLATWLAAFVMGSWAVSDPNIFTTKGYETYICLSLQSILEKKYLPYTLTTVTITAIGYLPTIPLYVHIFVVVRKSSSKFGIKREAVLARRIFLLVGTNVFFLALPLCLSHVAIATGSLGGFSETSTFIMVICTKVICTSLNALLNPILYGYRNDNFKRELDKGWQRLRKGRRNKLMDREVTPHRKDQCQKQDSLTCSSEL